MYIRECLHGHGFYSDKSGIVEIAAHTSASAYPKYISARRSTGEKLFRAVVVRSFRTPTDQVSRIRTVAGGFGLAAGSVCTVGEVCAHFLIVLTFVQPDRAAIGNIHIKARFTVFPLFQHFGLIGVKVKTGRVIGVIISSGCEVVGARYALEFVIAGIFFDGQSVFRKEQVYRSCVV